VGTGDGPNSTKVILTGADLWLTVKEFSIMELDAQCWQIVSQEELLEHVWTPGPTSLPDTKVTSKELGKMDYVGGKVYS
jgi:DNA-binding response OmpR family regulator